MPADPTPAASEPSAALQGAEEALGRERELAAVVLAMVGDAVMTVDAAGAVTSMNMAAEQLTGWPSREACGRALGEIFSILDGATRQPDACPAAAAMRENRAVALDTRSLLVRRDGSECGVEHAAAPLHDAAARVAGAVLVFHDVCLARATAQRMAYEARHDGLTALPNRSLLRDRLTQATILARRHQRRVALLYIDLDRFKAVNDTHGHLVGDALLRAVAERLQSCVRTSDTVSRQGGDEFIVLLAEVEDVQDAARCAQKILAALGEAVIIDGNSIVATPSIGISIFPDDGEDVEAVVRNADTAMYHAKQCGRNNYQFFTRDMNERALARSALEAELRRAIAGGQLLLHYQPKVDLASGAMTGAEALIRWQHPQRGLLLPRQFLPLAEECGLIVEIGAWALGEACRQAQAWRQAQFEIGRIAVNVSAAEFCARSFLDRVRAGLDDCGLAPAYLELELGEAALAHDAVLAARQLDELKAMGLAIACDGFGTGRASLGEFTRFHVDTINIDRSFVSRMLDDVDDADIVDAIIGMGRSLHRRVLAEGVESAEQADYLRARRCDAAQGHRFGRPLDAAGFGAMLAARQDAGRG
jgi:diguanylate cyclase (GGDEF)-like protein/PAS domain S-box-containing protein